MVGSAAALALRRRGLKVTLLEQFYIGHTRGSSHGPSRIIRYLYDHERYLQLMPNAYKLWKQLEEEEDVKLYTKSGIMNISSKHREHVYTDILKKYNLDHSTFTNEDVSYPVNLRLVELLFELTNCQYIMYV